MAANPAECDWGAYEAVQSKLPSLWARIFPQDDQPYTSVVVPSLSADPADPTHDRWAPFGEERLLFLLIRLRNPRARLIYVTSRPIPEAVLDYYLQLLAGIPASHARSRLTLLCAYDCSARPLVEKVLERPRLLQRIRTAIRDRERAYLTVFRSTPLEAQLAVELGIPLNGLDPRLGVLGTKSGARRVFREAGVECPAGIEDLRDEADVIEALAELVKRRPGVRRAVIKRDESASGLGCALFDYGATGEADIAAALDRARYATAGETRASFFEQFGRTGGVVEEWLDGERVASPSVQLRINPKREVSLASTHEQLLGGPTGRTFVGCVFPAADAYRVRLQDAGRRVGEVLAKRDVVSRFSVDFVARRDPACERWDLAALEINLRMGGTTHTMLALRFLTGGEVDSRTGLFHAPSGRAKYYRATDELMAETYRGLSPEDLVEIVTLNRLDYDQRTETGVLFHEISALSEQGRVGAVAIGNSREEAEALLRRAANVLDAEARGGAVKGTKPTDRL